MLGALEAAQTHRMDSAELIGLWDDWLAADGKSDDTRTTYRKATWAFLAQIKKPLEDVTELDIITFLASVGPQGPARSWYSCAIRSCFTFMVLFDFSEVRLERIPSPPTPPAPPQTAYIIEELERVVIAAAWRDRWRRHPLIPWAILLGVSLGTRRGELARIRPEDVNLIDRTVLVTGKGGKQRYIELSDLAVECLNELRPHWNGTILGGRKPATVTNWVHKVVTDASDPDNPMSARKHRSHVAMRATFASWLLDEGAPLPAVRDLLGHENLATTDRYAMSFPATRRRSVEVVTNRVRGAQ